MGISVCSSIQDSSKKKEGQLKIDSNYFKKELHKKF